MEAKIQQLCFTGEESDFSAWDETYQTFLNETKWPTKRIQQEEREEEMNADVGFEEDYQKVGGGNPV